jgi:nitrite reductase/ring-hydroxylating ferredoxin subunit/DMSO/TMAO reductase YedYZ heme-binding membrane subunit
MSLRYLAVNWNRQKRIYDGLVAGAVLLAVAGFAAVTLALHPSATIETALIRGLGFTGFLLLTLILAIGPLARLDRRFLPLLYNRRHLGVTLGLLAVGHAVFAVFQYHALGNLDPIASLLSSNTDFGSLSDFPFELFGVVALIILFLMAATSHDYWLSALTPPVWKRLHMLVYVAYLAVALHVGLGLLQEERHRFYLGFLLASVVAIGGLHLVAALRERPGDRPLAPTPGSDWVAVGNAADIPEGRAIVAVVAGERVAVFRHEGRLSCISNVCKHQNGPLGEGRIIDGCITCPWHGYQYRPDSGTSPPPFQDSVPTFNLAIAGGRVLVDPRPNPPGTRVEPVPAAEPPARPEPEFYVGYAPVAPPATARFTRAAAVAILLAAGGLIGAFAAAQQSFEPAAFDYGSEVTVEGTVRAHPYPILEVARPGRSIGASRYLLAAFGKHGAQASTADLDGRSVRIRGFFAYRGNLTLLELASIEGAPAIGAPSGEPVGLGEFTLRGEIVDSKCYSGVMNPGAGKTHRACAARCLAGGVTPLLAVADSAGGVLEMVVLDPRGQPYPDVHRWAGRPVSVRGQVSRLDDLWFIRVVGLTSFHP